MRKQLLTCFSIALFLSNSSTAQSKREDSSTKETFADTLTKSLPVQASTGKESEEFFLFEKVDVKPGINLLKWRRHLEKNLQSFIDNAAKKGMKAGYYTVMVRFIVEKDGSITDVNALNDPGNGLAAVSEEVLKTGSQWKPGEYNGKKVRSSFTQPITFVIPGK